MQNAPESDGHVEAKKLPAIVILGTGGTIAAAGASAVNTSDYVLKYGVESVIASVPEVHFFAKISGEQVANVPSQDIGNDLLLLLAKRVNVLLASESVDGIVITHGTDTMEETAYFLNLVIKSKKAVVFVGAMRPSTAISADGPLNLLNAVKVAASPKSRGKGVLIVLNDRIGAARFMEKRHTTGTDAFSMDEYGVIGSVVDSVVEFHSDPLRIHTVESDFDVSDIDELPAVDIVYGYQGIGPHLFSAAIASGARGLVFAATGNGTLSTAAKHAATLACENGVAFVRSTRVGKGLVSFKSTDVELNTIASNSLNPQKARLLLMLALTRTNERQRIQDYFDSY